MKKLLSGVLFTALTLLLSACGDSGGDSRVTESGATSSRGTQYTKDMANACDLVSADLVAATFSLPAQDLKQTKMMGCIYTWSNEETQLQAAVIRVRAHKSTEAATNWFANATRNRSADEVQAELDQVAARLESREDLNKTAKQGVAAIMRNGVDAAAVVYRDVPNLGDAARSSADGSISLRVSNLTLNVAAYHGAKQPDTQLSGLGVKQMIEVAKQEAKAWEEQTAPQRLQDSTKLAQAIIAKL